MKCLGIIGNELRKMGINAEFENWRFERWDVKGIG